jgi:hypothetical protein
MYTDSFFNQKTFFFRAQLASKIIPQKQFSLENKLHLLIITHPHQRIFNPSVQSLQAIKLLSKGEKNAYSLRMVGSGQVNTDFAIAPGKLERERTAFHLFQEQRE